MIEMFGNFCEEGETPEFLVISFSSTTKLPIQDRWRNKSLSADFLADYWGTFFLVQNASAQELQAEVKDAVSYISNELLENAVKFHYEPDHAPIKIGIYLFREALRFYVTNSIDPQSVKSFQQYIHTLLTEDPGELFFQQLERNATQEDSTESHLGLLTIINDYQGEIAWKFENMLQHPDIILVTTMVQLEIVRPSF